MGASPGLDTRVRLAGQWLADILRAAHEQEYLAAKATDFHEFTRWALLLTGVFVLGNTVWDYTIDPVNAWRVVWLRWVESAAIIAWAMLSWRDLRAPIARAAFFVVPLLAQCVTIKVLSMLDHGASYGMGAFLYSYIFAPFLLLAQPFAFSVFVLAALTALPMLVAPLGLSAGLDWDIYNVYTWMAFLPVVGMLLLFEYIYLRVFDYRRQIEVQASTDMLTRIANRRHFLGESDGCLAWHRDQRREASVLFVDIDRFKAVNDAYGHAVGDAAINHVVQRLLPVLRASDLPARYGGEEFAVLLRETGYTQALRIAERMRATIAAHPFWPEVDGAPAIRLTVSIGVATYQPSDAADIDVLVHAADRALYEAKQSGRDCVVGCAA